MPMRSPVHSCRFSRLFYPGSILLRLLAVYVDDEHCCCINVLGDHLAAEHLSRSKIPLSHI